MPAPTEIPSQISWFHDRPDSSFAPIPETPYFDSALQAWVLSRYADVAAALHSPSLLPVSLTGSESPAAISNEEHRAMRAETLAALPAPQLRLWRNQLLRHAEELLSQLPADRPVDLLGEYARPLCLSLAATITRVQHDDPKKLCEHARAISASSADPYNPSLRVPSKSAAAHLQPFFPPGPESLRRSGFVALTQIMPALLGNTWFILLQHPHQWEHLHRHPRLIQPAIEDLMRLSGLTRTLTRQATADIHLNGTDIRKGQRVILRLIAANKDPEVFDHPSELNIARRTAKHLSFGAGPHACTGAGLLRMIAAATTVPLLSRFAAAPLAHRVDWKGGATFLTPQSLWVHLHR